MKKRSILTVIIAGIVAVGLVGCGNSGSSSSNDDKVIKVGVSPVPHEEIMEVAKPLLEEKGYTVEIVEFTDYVLPNTSLENGEIDANYFQHIAYLNSFNEDNGTHLTYTAEIHLEPMGAFSKKYKSVDEVEEGATVAVPDDPSNEARALRVLAAAGLIEVNDGELITIADITSNPRFLSISSPFSCKFLSPIITLFVTSCILLNTFLLLYYKLRPNFKNKGYFLGKVHNFYSRFCANFPYLFSPKNRKLLL